MVRCRVAKVSITPMPLGSPEPKNILKPMKYLTFREGSFALIKEKALTPDLCQW